MLILAAIVAPGLSYAEEQTHGTHAAHGAIECVKFTRKGNVTRTLCCNRTPTKFRNYSSESETTINSKKAPAKVLSCFMGLQGVAVPPRCQTLCRWSAWPYMGMLWRP